MDLVTIPGVELVRVGSWRGSKNAHGDVTNITAKGIADAIAAEADPEVHDAPLKIGHTSQMSTDLGDGAPALGWIANLRASDDGTRLLGDLTDVPAKLAALLPKAFRRRSAELKFGVTTARGRTYEMTLDALALLGVTPPAVSGLADVASIYGLAADAATGDVVAVTFAAGDVDAARLAELDATIAAVDALKLPDDRRARIVAELEDAAGVTDATIPAGSHAPRHDDHRTRSTTEGTETMDDAQLRTLLGIEADADLEKAVADIKVKADAAPQLDANGKPVVPAGGPALDANGKPIVAPAEPAVDPAKELAGAGALSAETVADLKAAGLTVIDAGTLEVLTTGVAAGTGAAAELKAARLSALVDDAVRSGKISPAEAGKPAADGQPATGFFALLETNEAGTTAVLSSMGRRYDAVVTTERGADLGVAADAVTDAQWDAFTSGVFGTDIPAPPAS